MFIFMFCYFLKEKSRCRPPIKAIYPVLCLKKLQSQNSLSKVSDKAVTYVFYCSPDYICYCCSVAKLCSSLCDPTDCSTSGKLHTIFQFYQGFYLFENHVKLLFCVTISFNITRIHYSIQRSLVRIVQRKLIGKQKIHVK